jgi:phosphate/sulfate permease
MITNLLFIAVCFLAFANGANDILRALPHCTAVGRPVIGVL